MLRSANCLLRRIGCLLRSIKCLLRDIKFVLRTFRLFAILFCSRYCYARHVWFACERRSRSVQAICIAATCKCARSDFGSSLSRYVLSRGVRCILGAVAWCSHTRAATVGRRVGRRGQAPWPAAAGLFGKFMEQFKEAGDLAMLKEQLERALPKLAPNSYAPFLNNPRPRSRVRLICHDGKKINSKTVDNFAKYLLGSLVVALGARRLEDSNFDGKLACILGASLRSIC